MAIVSHMNSGLTTEERDALHLKLLIYMWFVGIAEFCVAPAGGVLW